MKNSLDIFKNIKEPFKKGRVSYDKRFTDPRRDWFIGLLLFIVLVGIGAVWSAQTFVQYRNVDTKGGTSEESLVQYNAKLIQEVVSVYEDRQSTYDALRTVVVPPVIVPVEDVEVSATSSATSTQEVVEIEEPEVPQSSSTEPLPEERPQVAN